MKRKQHDWKAHGIADQRICLLCGLVQRHVVVLDKLKWLPLQDCKTRTRVKTS